MYVFIYSVFLMIKNKYYNQINHLIVEKMYAIIIKTFLKEYSHNFSSMY